MFKLGRMTLAFMVAMLLILVLTAGSCAKPQTAVDPEKVVQDWFDSNRDTVSTTVSEWAFSKRPSLASIGADVARQQFDATVITDIGNAERITTEDGPVFLVTLTTSADFTIDQGGVPGMVAVSFPWELSFAVYPPKGGEVTVDAVPDTHNATFTLSLHGTKGGDVEGVEIEGTGGTVTEGLEKLGIGE